MDIQHQSCNKTIQTNDIPTIKNNLQKLRVCPREDQAEVTHATSPIFLKLSQMIKVIKLFKNPK